MARLCISSDGPRATHRISYLTVASTGTQLLSDRGLDIADIVSEDRS